MEHGIPFYASQEFWLITIPTLLLGLVTFYDSVHDKAVIKTLIKLLAAKTPKKVKTTGKHYRDPNPGRHERSDGK